MACVVVWAASCLSATVAYGQPVDIAPGPGDESVEPVAEYVEPVAEYVTIVSAGAGDDGPSIVEVGREAIERQGAQSPVDVLDTLPSAVVSSNIRGEQTFVIRGFDARQTAILVDGSPTYLAYDGTTDLSMIPALALERVTVIQGPASIFFGPNGLGGAINLVTRRPGRGPLLQTRVEGTIPGSIRLSAWHTKRVGPVAWAVYGGWDQREAWPLSTRFQPTPNQPAGLRLNSDETRGHLGAAVRASVARGHELAANALWIEGSRGVPPDVYDPDPRYWRFDTWRMVGASVAHEGSYAGGIDLEESVFVRRFETILNGYDDATYSNRHGAGAFRSTWTDWTIGGRVRGRLRLDRTPWGPTHIRLWAGAQHDRHRQQDDTATAAREVDRTLVTLAPEIEARFTPKWSLTLGCQVDVEVPGNLPGASKTARVGPGPLASVRWSPVDGLVLRATTARRTRFPTLKERFAEVGGTRDPNPGLAPESAWHFGLEASWRVAPNCTLRIAGHDAEVSGLIEPVALGAGREQVRNVGTARLAGIDASVQAQIGRWLDLDLGYAWLHARRTDARAPGDRLVYRPASKGTLAVVVRPLRLLELSTRLAIVGPQDFVNPVNRARGRLGTYVQWDGRVDLRPTSALDLWVRVTNLLDSNHQTGYGFFEPGRQILIGLDVALAEPGQKGGK